VKDTEEFNQTVGQKVNMIADYLLTHDLYGKSRFSKAGDWLFPYFSFSRACYATLDMLILFDKCFNHKLIRATFKGVMC
jgi:hypothetical protein